MAGYNRSWSVENHCKEWFPSKLLWLTVSQAVQRFHKTQGYWRGTPRDLRRCLGVQFDSIMLPILQYNAIYNYITLQQSGAPADKVDSNDYGLFMVIMEFKT